MKISVIIPVYNGERYIAQCLENVLCQSHRDLEIIVVDDGSTDATAATAARYPSVRVISQPNGGLSVARNKGIEAATGEYIHFLDVDDLLNGSYYERMADAITPCGNEAPIGESKRPIDMVFGGYINGLHPVQSLRFDDRLLLTTLNDKIWFTNAGIAGYAWRYLIRRSFIERTNLRFEPGRMFEDAKFTLDALALSEGVATSPGATYHYMKRAGSILNERNPEHVRKRKEQYRLMRAWRRDYYARHGLGPVVKTIRRSIYKLLGIPAITRIDRNDGKSRWYIFGILILQRRVRG